MAIELKELNAEMVRAAIKNVKEHCPGFFMDRISFVEQKQLTELRHAIYNGKIKTVDGIPIKPMEGLD